MQLPRICTALRRFAAAAPLTAAATLVFGIAVPTSTQTAIANGDTRTLSLHHAHRKDSITVTFRRNGSYDSGGLEQLNHFLRDWRNDQSTRMDPRLFDVIWESQRGVSASAPILVLSAYRSPTTNAMLRSRSRAVAKESQHMHGKAMDMRFPDANMHRVREVALRLQRGGVGWYGSSNFVHLDVGSVRTWPRLSYDHLARLFPDGRSVHVSADGRVLPGYEEARSIVASRGGAYVPTLAQVKEKSFLARLFGFEDDDEAESRASARGGARGRVVASAPAARVPASATDDSSAASFFRAEAARRSGSEPAPAQVAAAQAAPARITLRAEPARIEPPKPEPRLARQVETDDDVPLPPRRPSQTQIAALIERAGPHVPVPPQKPSSLIVVAEAARAAAAEQAEEQLRASVPLPPTRTAAVRTAANLPAVITQGAPGAASPALNAAGLLAYAPTVQPQAAENIRKVVPRRAGTAKPPAVGLAKYVGVRSARIEETTPFIAARLDRSNFTGLTDGRRMSQQPTASFMGSTVTPLRAAARHDPSRLMFAPADAPARGFTPNANPGRAENFSPSTMRQASSGAPGRPAAN